MATLFENLQLMQESKNDSVTTICYNQKQHWDNRQDAIDFFYDGMMSTEGSESNRYQKIYSELISGKKICTDEESDMQSVYESATETDKRYYTINIAGVNHVFTDVYKNGNHFSAYEVNKNGKPGKFLHRLSQAEIDRAIISDTFLVKGE